ncbi:MAG TPA: penicillin-binding protein 2 [Gammaproteobacteria bacterium]|nr:penicillin-binding protein 2 [Gammaproteobacteria bacterium]
MRNLIKDQQAEKRLLFRRALTAGLGMAALLLVLLGRLGHLQVVGYQHYTMLAQDNRVKLVALPPPRGLIYDRNGVLLAENRPSFQLVLTPEEVKDINATLKQLSAIIDLSESDINRFRELLGRTRRFEEIPLKLRLSEAEVARFAVNRHRFPGVEVQAQATRYYPLGAVASHAIGYVGRINAEELRRLHEQGRAANYSGSSHIGKLGIELYYQELLHGTVGVEKVETNALGRVIRTLERTPPIPGKDIHLSLDIRLQQAAEAALGDHTGSIVVIAPKTGEVLAFVSQPTYDLNLFVNGIDVDTYKALQEDPRTPLFNRALRGQYPPGSTIKPLVALAALEHGVVRTNEQIFCPGYYMLPGIDHRYRDWKRSGHGSVNLIEAVAQSCDVYFYDIAYKLGIDNLSSFMQEFGLGHRTSIDLPGELPGLMPSRAWKRANRNQPWFHGETLITGIGQGFMLATPLQLAEATATLANRGVRIRPHLRRAITDADSEQAVPIVEPPRPPIRIRNERYWDDVIESMRQVVHGRTGTARGVGHKLSYQMAGKSGTAQVFTIAQDARYDASKLARELHDHGLFLAFAPVKDPEVALAVVIEHGSSGSGVAAPIASEVLDAYMEFKRIDAERQSKAE